MEEKTARRIGENEAYFRDLNGRVHRGVEGAVDDSERDEIAFLCECGDGACERTIGLTEVDYAEVRASPARFAVVPGHEIHGAEHVVEYRGDASIVEKVGLGRREAEQRA